MSDLHCPATLLLAPYVEGAEPSAEGSRRLVERAAVDNVSRIYAGTRSEVAQTIGAVETRVPATSEQRPELDGNDVADALSAIADLHRGETVLVLLPVAIIECTLDLLVGRRARLRRQASMHYGSVVEVAVDADGWLLRTPDTRTDSVPDLGADREIRDVRAK